jgi:hypothetical protein
MQFDLVAHFVLRSEHRWHESRSVPQHGVNAPAIRELDGYGLVSHSLQEPIKGYTGLEPASRM